MVYVTSDLHICHENIIKYCERPFKKIKDFEKYYIQMHNSIVKDDDIVIFVGDMMWGRKSNKRKLKRFLNKLNGRLWLIKGNHDTLNDIEYYKMGFELVRDYLIIGKTIICHYQLINNQYSTEKELSLIHLLKKYKIDTVYHGHIHNRDSYTEDKINRINCCIDYSKNEYKLICTNFDLF